MPRRFNTTGIYINSGLASCAYHCRYCQLVHIKPTTFGVDRFVGVIEKFLDYKEKNNLCEFDIGFWNGYSYDCSLCDFQKELDLHKKIGDWELKILLLGGIPHMADDVLQQWFSDRKAIGSEFASASYFGYGEMHDYWNNMKGNFDFLINAQKVAVKAGLYNEQRLFLTNSTLPIMEQLLDKLDAEVPDVRKREGYPLFYSGLARRYENERVSMEILDAQSERVQAIYRGDKANWKSERDWIEFSRTAGPKYESGSVTLTLTDQNIDQIEAISCEEIMDDLSRRTQDAYNSVPSRDELADKYSDPDNNKIYMFLWDMECLWIDRYLKENPTSFERALTHFGR
ncbi:MAG: hypothetical protein PHX59_09975 [Sulfuricurvum sp.]|nr:hypothetical protein [Sulfuricurvum sp.]